MNCIEQWKMNLQKNDMQLVIHSVFKTSVSACLLRTYYAPGTDEIMRDTDRLFIINENIIKQFLIEERLAKKN